MRHSTNLATSTNATVTTAHGDNRYWHFLRSGKRGVAYTVRDGEVLWCKGYPTMPLFDLIESDHPCGHLMVEAGNGAEARQTQAILEELQSRP